MDFVKEISKDALRLWNRLDTTEPAEIIATVFPLFIRYFRTLGGSRGYFHAEITSWLDCYVEIFPFFTLRWPFTSLRRKRYILLGNNFNWLITRRWGNQGGWGNSPSRGRKIVRVNMQTRQPRGEVAWQTKWRATEEFWKSMLFSIATSSSLCDVSVLQLFIVTFINDVKGVNYSGNGAVQCCCCTN